MVREGIQVVAGDVNGIAREDQRIQPRTHSISQHWFAAVSKRFLSRVDLGLTPGSGRMSSEFLRARGTETEWFIQTHDPM